MKPTRMLSALLLVLGVSALAQDSAPGPAAGEVREPAGEGTESPTPDLAQIQREIVELRGEIQQLRETMDLYLGKIVEQLQDENGLLRQEISRLYELQPAPQAEANLVVPGHEAQVPRSGDLGAPNAVGTQGAKASFSVVEPEASAPIQESAARALGDFKYTVVKEWGRTPEEAKGLGGDVSSLKGVIGAVSAVLSDEDLIAFARALRQEFDHYDNINVEFFNDLDAANHYTETGEASPEHRILTISKYRDTARDLILLIRGDAITVVPWEKK